MKKPFWMRRYWACPDCGHIFAEFEHEPPRTGIDCPRCETHFAIEDFMDENCEKWDCGAVIEGEEEAQLAALEEYVREKR